MVINMIRIAFTVLIIFRVIVKVVILKVLPQIQRREWWQKLNSFTSSAGIFWRHFVCLSFGRRPRKKCTRVSHEVVLKIARLAISMEPTPLLEKVSSYSLLTLLWLLVRPSEPLLPKQIKERPPPPTFFFVGSNHVITKRTILFKASQ